MTTPASPVPTSSAAAEAAFRRRSLTTASILLALSAAALWGSSRLAWARLVAGDGLGEPRDFTVRGADWSTFLTPLAIVLIAAIAAVVSLRGWALRIVSVIVAVIGVLGMTPAISLLTGDSAGTYAAKAISLPGRYQVTMVETHGWAASLVFVAGLLAVAAAVVIMRSVRGSTGMSSKYKSPAARRADLEEQIFADRPTGTPAGAPPTEPTSGSSGTRSAGSADSTPAVGEPGGLNERMLWDALDSGTDPTATTSAAPDPDETDVRGRPGGETP